MSRADRSDTGNDFYDHENRRSEELVVGRQAVLAALRTGKPISIILAEGLKGTIINEIAQLARQGKVPVKRLSRNDFSKEVGDITGNQGVAARVSPFKYVELEELIALSGSSHHAPFLIMLDHLEDPHNLGAVMRTADAAGVSGLIIPSNRAAGVTATVRKVACGAAERIPVAMVGNLNQAAEILKKEGFWLYGAEADGDQEFYRADFRRSIVLVIGSEGKGLSKLLRQNCDLTLSIPMPGAGSGSLNVSAAAAVIIYAALSQRGVDTLMAPILIVDGYNIIGAWDELKGLKAIDLGSARDQLISILSAYYPWCWERIIIVFDGQRFAWDHYDGVEVVFTEGRQTADTMIEKLAAGLSPYYRVEVATSDFAEFRAASNLGAMVLSAPSLKERLEEQQSIYRSRLKEQTSSKGIMLNDLLNESLIATLEKLRRL